MRRKTFLMGFVVFLLLYYVVFFFPLGFCEAVGMKTARGGLNPRPFCYMPSGYEGQPCDKQTDCGTGHCALINPNVTRGKGVCRDLQFGCGVWIDKEGNFDEDFAACID